MHGYPEIDKPCSFFIQSQHQIKQQKLFLRRRVTIDFIQCTLLQYALTELFDNRQGRLLTQGAYQEMGGTIGALAKRADEIFENLPPEGQSLARQMFLRLGTV